MKIEEAIQKFIEDQNVLRLYFRLEDRKHLGSCNVQCLKSFIYKKFIKKNGFGKYVEFTPHPKGLHGIDAPSKEELNRLGFTDVNIALADTI